MTGTLQPILDFLQGCPLIPDQVDIGFVPGRPGACALVQGQESCLEHYFDGCALCRREFALYLRARSFESAERLLTENCLEQIAAWMEMQQGDLLPDLGNVGEAVGVSPVREQGLYQTDQNGAGGLYRLRFFLDWRRGEVAL